MNRLQTLRTANSDAMEERKEVEQEGGDADGEKEGRILTITEAYFHYKRGLFSLH